MKRRILKIEVTLLILLVLSIPYIYFFQPARAVRGLYRLYALRAGMLLQSAEADTKYRLPFYGKRLEKKDWPALVLLHGISNTKIAFLQSSYYLPDRYRLILPDFPGSGDTEKLTDRRYHIKAQAAALRAFLRSLGISHAYLVGNSMGGHIAAAFAIDYPEIVSGMILISPAGLTVTEKKPYSLLTNPLQSESDFDLYMQKAFVKVPWVPAPFKTMFIQESQRNFLWEQRLRREIRSGPHYILDNLIQKIRTPTLIVWGDQDRIISVQHAPVWRKKIPQAELLILKDCGHGPQYERPAETAKIISDYFARLTPAQPSNN